MAPKQVRARVAVATTGAAAAVLLALPAFTMGLTVPTAGSSGSLSNTVSSTTQGVTNTVQQTTTQVASQVQTTVQQTTQAVAAPEPVAAPAAPAPAAVQQAQTSVRDVAAAPQQAASRTGTASPVERAKVRELATRTSAAAGKLSSGKVRAGTRAGAQAPGAARNATDVARSGSRAAAGKLASVKGGVTRTASRVRALGVSKLVTRDSTSVGRAATADCLPLPALPIISDALDLNALLALACSAAGVLSGSGSGQQPTTADTASAPKGSSDLLQVLGVMASGSSALARPLMEFQGSQLVGAYGASGGGRDLGLAGRDARGVAGASASGVNGRGVAATYAFGAAPAPFATTEAFGTANAAGQSRHGIFSGPVDGTTVLGLILTLCLALLGAIGVWRAAQRWIVPRYA